LTTTSLSLLERLRAPGDQKAWLRFVRLYTPLLYHWTRRIGLAQHEAEDLIQDVFELLLRKLPEFRYAPGGSFRNWLRMVALNKWRERRRRAAHFAASSDSMEQIAAPDETGPFEEAEYRRHVVAQALRMIEPEFSSTTWTAFQEHVVGGRDAADVADALKISVGTVYAAKSRVLTRLRRHLDGLLDD
jgi:RNA polymerase sigma-70 factor (ECF subfamily)